MELDYLLVLFNRMEYFGNNFFDTFLLLMNIVFFLPNINSYLDRVKTLKRLSDKGHSMTLILGSYDSRDKLLDSENFNAINAGFIPGQRPLNLIRAYKALSRVNSEKSIDIIHDTFGNFLLYFLFNFMKKDRPVFITSFYALDKWRIKNVWNPIGQKFFDLLKTPSGRRMLAGSFVQSFLTKICDHVILQSPGLRERFEKYYLNETSKIRIVPNSVDTDFWVPKNKCEFSKDGKIKLLYVGRFDFTSAFKNILVAVKDLSNKVSIQLTLVHKAGPLDEYKVMEMARHYDIADNIIFNESPLTREEMRDIYRDQDILIYQTINDGSPRVVIEAISSGLPVIASYHPGINILDPSKEYIIFTEFGNSAQISSKIMEFVDSKIEYQDISVKGRTKIIEMFTINKIAEIYHEVYNDAIAESVR